MSSAGSKYSSADQLVFIFLFMALTFALNFICAQIKGKLVDFQEHCESAAIQLTDYSNMTIHRIADMKEGEDALSIVLIYSFPAKSGVMCNSSNYFLC